MQRWPIPLLVVLAVGVPAALRQDGAGRAEETMASATLQLGGGQDVVLRYRTRVFDEDFVRRMRADPGVRESLNQRLPILLGAELTVPVAVTAGDARIEPGTWRVALRMGEGGEWQLAVQRGREFVAFPFDLVTSAHRFPWLCLALTPARDGAFTLVLQWGPDLGRAVFRAAP